MKKQLAVMMAVAFCLALCKGITYAKEEKVDTSSGQVNSGDKGKGDSKADIKGGSDKGADSGEEHKSDRAKAVEKGQQGDRMKAEHGKAGTVVVKSEVVNPDGSKTAIQTKTKKDGSVEIKSTTKNIDGSIIKSDVKKDANGNVISEKIEVKNTDGTTTITIKDGSGKIIKQETKKEKKNKGKGEEHKSDRAKAVEKGQQGDRMKADKDVESKTDVDKTGGK